MKKNYLSAALILVFSLFISFISNAKGPQPSTNGFKGFYVVSGSVVSAENGVYGYAGNSGGYLYFSRIGDNPNNTSYIIWDGSSQWQLGQGCCGGSLNNTDCYVTSSDSLPPDTVWSCPNLSVKFAASAVQPSNSTLFESAKDNGSIAGNTTLKLSTIIPGVKFAGNPGDDFIAGQQIAAMNVPNGLTAKVIKANDSLLTVSFTGFALNNNHTANGWVKFQLADACYQGTQASNVNGSLDSIYLNFRQTYQVASVGAPYTRIDSAVNAASDFDIIQISGETYTEQITANKGLIFQGNGADKTIIQVASTPKTTNGTVFSINTANPTVFSGLSIQNGYYNGNSNAWGLGVYAPYGGPVVFYDCRVANNVGISVSGAAAYGGAVYVGGPLTAYNSEFSNNTITNGILNGQILGGAISSNDTVTIVNCTFSGDSAIGTGSLGGAIFAGASNKLTIINSTFTNNFATTNGGAFYTYSNTYIYNSILYGNNALVNPDIDIENGDTLHAYNSIIKNFGGNIGLADTSKISVADPLLVPLANNGGTTQTIALAKGSPAIDGSLNSPLTTAIDQRHFNAISIRDIGAYEFGGASCNPTQTNFSARICFGTSYKVGQHTYLKTGNYSDTLKTTVGGCDSIISTSLVVLPKPIVNTAYILADSCSNGCRLGGALIQVISQTPYNIVWADSTANGWANMAQHTSDTLTNVSNGTYRATVTDSCGNTAVDTVRIPYVNTTGIQNTGASNFGLSIYPNPSNGTVKINIAGMGSQTLLVYDVTGRQQQIVNLNSNQLSQQFTVNWSNLPEGIYTVKVIYNDHITTNKMVVAH